MVNPYTPPQIELAANGSTIAHAEPAGFIDRLLAAVIDGFIMMGFAIVVGILIGVLGSLLGTGNVPEVVGNFLGLVIGWLYGALQESSEARATWGKRALGLQVVDLQGGRISFGRATGRHFAKWISLAILLLGYFMMLWTKRRQTLHDLMAGCFVLNTKSMRAVPLNTMTPEERANLVGEQLCHHFGITAAQKSRTFSDLRIPSGNVQRALDDLAIDYAMPISSDDARLVSSVSEVMSLVASRG